MTENGTSADREGRACLRKKLHSKELLCPPKGPGVPLVLKELRKEVGLGTAFPPKIFRTEESSVLSRVKTFLPQLEQADDELKQRLETEPLESVDIENVAEGEPCIQMDLAVVQLPCSSDSEEESSSSSSDSSDSDGDRFPLRTSRRCKRKRTNTVKIEEIGGR